MNEIMKRMGKKREGVRKKRGKEGKKEIFFSRFLRYITSKGPLIMKRIYSRSQPLTSPECSVDTVVSCWGSEITALVLINCLSI